MGIGRTGRGILIAAGAALLLLAPGSVAQAEGAWLSSGTASSSDGGAWHFEADSAEDLIGKGLTLVRVTSAACATDEDEAIVFEAQLKASQTPDNSWEGKLTPLGAAAQRLPGGSSNGDVRLIPAAGGTTISVGLDGLPPGTDFVVCLRQP